MYKRKATSTTYGRKRRLTPARYLTSRSIYRNGYVSGRGFVATFTRTANLGVISMPADALSLAGNNQFSLAAFPSYTDITNAFDEFRVVRVTYTVLPVCDTGVGNVIYAAVDFVDTGNPTEAELLQMDTLRIKSGQSPLLISFTPKYSDTTTQWMRTADATMALSTVKTLATVPSATNAPRVLYRVFASATILARNTK